METKDIISTIALIVSLASIWISYKRARSTEHSLEEQRASSARAAIIDYIVREYLEREFKMTQPPAIHGKIVRSLREAKQHARKEYEQNPEKWDKASRRSNLGAWQNAVAFETAWVLENLGATVFSGALPLGIALAIVGDVVIDDWILCRSWVNSYREDEKAISQVQTTHTPGVHYHRRHAEWLALIATLWMTRHWRYPNCDLIADWYGGKQNLPQKIRALSRADGALMPQTVRHEVKSLTKIDLSQ